MLIQVRHCRSGQFSFTIDTPETTSNNDVNSGKMKACSFSGTEHHEYLFRFSSIDVKQGWSLSTCDEP